MSKLSLKSTTLPILLLSICLFPVTQAFAHSGRTDASGCHHDRKNGGYHCHNSGTSTPSQRSSPSSAPLSTPLNSPGNIIELPPRPVTPIINSLVSAQVISVGDGDTIRVASQRSTMIIRFACIDAPETAQTPWGTTAANRLKSLLPIGQTVALRVVDTDQYGRAVAEVFKGGQSVNLQLVKEGQAVVYQQYINACADTKAQYLQSESQAKQQRLGYWNQVNPVMPWNFRSNQR